MIFQQYHNLLSELLIIKIQYYGGIKTMYNITPLLDRRVNSKHIEIAEILWDEPNDIYSIENYINNTAMTDSERNLCISTIDSILLDLVLFNWVVIKHDMYCLTPYGRKILENISDRSFGN
jgi:hypothetical protein